MPLHDDLLSLLYDERVLRLKELERIFNPLRVLGVEHYEIRHVKTLAWLLDPDESHGLGDAFLTRFVRAVAVKTGNPAVLGRLALNPDGGVRIKREASEAYLSKLHEEELLETIDGDPDEADKADASGNKPIDGALDLLVEATDRSWVLCVEAKIKSGEHSNQLRRYREALHKGIKQPGDRQPECALVLLTLDAANQPGDPAWVNMTWQETVIPALKEILVGQPERHSRPALQFIASYVEVLEDLCSGSKGIREQLIADLIATHDETLNKVCGRRVGALPKDVQALIGANARVFREISRRYQTPSKRRLPLFEEFVRSLEGITRARSSTRFIRFTPTPWLKHEWVRNGMDQRLRFPSVVCEVWNIRDGGFRFKLMVTDVGDEFKLSPYFSQRNAFYQAAQSHPLASKLFSGTLVAGGAPRPKRDPEFPAVQLTRVQDDPAAMNLDGMLKFYEEVFRPSVDAASQLIAEIR